MTLTAAHLILGHRDRPYGYRDHQHITTMSNPRDIGPMHWIIGEDGEPKAVDVLVWGAWFQEASENGSRIVALDNFGPLGEVSTVFLGLDHSFSRLPGDEDHRPVLWESMIFGGPLCEEQDRYASKDDALKGHARMVKRLQDIQALIAKKFGDAWSELSEEEVQRAVDAMLRIGGIEVGSGDDVAIIVKVGNEDVVSVKEITSAEELDDVLGPES